jgi:hypothetical protein
VTTGHKVSPRRRAAVELAYFLASEGQPPLGPVAMAVTEGREAAYDRGPGSSCVELVDCVMYAVGCRDEAINRDEHRGRHSQRDLGWYLPGSQHSGRIITHPSAEQLNPGDPIGYDFHRGGHAAIFLGWLPSGRVLTADYGQPGGRIYSCFSDDHYSCLTLRGRVLDASVDLDSLECPGQALTVGEWLESHGMDVRPWVPYELVCVETRGETWGAH